MQWPKISLKYVLLLVALSFGAGGYLYHQIAQKHATRVVETPAPPAEVEQTYPHILPSNASFSSVLKDLGVSPRTIADIVSGAKPVINLSKVRAGIKFRLMHLTDPTSDLVGLELQVSPIERVKIEKLGGKWAAERRLDKVLTRIVTFNGEVQSNLWASAETARMDPNLIIQLAEIFAWELDFAREVRLGDRWRLSVEEKVVRGKSVGWGSILAAEYSNGGKNFTAVLFQVSPDQSGYFSADGTSLRRAFLKSPLRYARISSRFQRQRFHPVMKINRPHLGVDYAAAVGTPVRAVGRGVVTMATWHNGGGKTVKIRHNSSYQTAYLHLSRFENGIRGGKTVQQGQVIGYVGSTGLATGPHLHFEFVHNGRVVDPLKQKFPPEEPIPADRIAEFNAHAANVLGTLPIWDSKSVADAGPAKLRIVR
jgi:murein DD-endopeptidase MepM/ murein hydrolase activator NlpD